jgi:hypothetical protein
VPEAEPWNRLEHNIKGIDSRLFVNKNKRVVACTECSDFKTALPAVLVGACDGVLDRCRKHVEGDKHTKAVDSGRRQQQLDLQREGGPSTDR